MHGFRGASHANYCKQRNNESYQNKVACHYEAEKKQFDEKSLTLIYERAESSIDQSIE